jgi:sodium-dependent dicarboxylate transporter 2/3/5
LVALSLEKWMLHKRFALLVLLRIGEKPKLILLGFMAIAWFLSMWLSNTCTAAVLLPMANAILVNLRSNEEPTTEQQLFKRQQDLNYSKAIILGIVYSCSIGGIGTLIGTPTNLVFASTLGEMFPKHGNFPFLTWQLYCTPLSAIFLIATWVILLLVYVRKYKFSHPTPQLELSEETGEEQESKFLSPMDTFRQEYSKLGPVKFEEVILTILFTLMSVLWITRELPFETSSGHKIGWASLLFIFTPDKAKYVGDGTVSILIAILLFVIPSKSRANDALLDWNFVKKKFPMNVLFLLGAGYALAKAFSITKFGDFLAQFIANLGPHLHAYILMTIIAISVTFFTEVSSNVATASILMPVLARLSVVVGQNPLLFMIPATLCCSFAFMLPVATPPNAIGFSYGYLKIRDMAVIGFIINWLGIFSVIIWQLSVGTLFLGIYPNVLPDWANSTRT